MDTDRRRLAATFALSGGLLILLLASHPHDARGSLRELLEAEARERVQNLVVHGGFLLVEVLSLIAFRQLLDHVRPRRFAATTGSVLLAAAAIALGGSMLVDGLVVPSLAARALAAGELDGEVTRAAFTTCRALIAALLPVGLVFEALAVLAWSRVLAAGAGRLRLVAAAGAVGGVALLTAAAATALALPPAVVYGGFAFLALWHLAIGGALLDRQDAPVGASGPAGPPPVQGRA